MRQKVLYVGPAENVSVFLDIFKKIDSARSWRVRGAFTQPAFMGSCLTISHTCFPCPPSRQVSPSLGGEVLRIFAYLTLGNSMSSTSMFFFSEKAHCIVSILCEHDKERG